jgi:hypothetical protein
MVQTHLAGDALALTERGGGPVGGDLDTPAPAFVPYALDVDKQAHAVGREPDGLGDEEAFDRYGRRQRQRGNGVAGQRCRAGRRRTP